MQLQAMQNYRIVKAENAKANLKAKERAYVGSN